MILTALKAEAAYSSRTPKPFSRLHHINPEGHNLKSNQSTVQEKTTISWNEAAVQIWVT